MVSNVIKDRVHETTGSSGTGDFVLTGAVDGSFVAFSSVCGNGDTFRYAAIDDVGHAFEVGTGTYVTASNRIQRFATPEASSNGNNLVSFLNAPHVFLTTSAQQFSSVLGGSSAGGTINQIQYNNTGTGFGGFTLSGDATLAVGTGVITVTKTAGVSFGAGATAGLATTSAAGIVKPDGTSITVDAFGVIHSAGGGLAGGSTGQLQVNNSGGFSGITMSGDGSINTSTGVITVTKTVGVSFGAGATAGVATTSAAGIVKPDGTSITTDAFGKISASGGSIATSTTVGTVKPDNSTIVVDGTGKISAVVGVAGLAGSIQYNNAGVPGGFTASGDATINTSTGAVTVTRTSGTAFGAGATAGIATIATAGIVHPDGSSIIIDGTGKIQAVTANVGGTVNQIQYNTGTAFGGFTIGQDATLNVSTGALNVTKTGGVAFGAGATAGIATNSANGICRPDNVTVSITAGVLSMLGGGPSNATPRPSNGSGAPGVGTLFSRDDHYHPTDNTKANLTGPTTFTGAIKSDTPIAGTNDTTLATTAFVATAISGSGGYLEAPNDAFTYGRHAIAWLKVAPLDSAVLTGTVTVPDQLAGTNNGTIANTKFVSTAVAAAGGWVDATPDGNLYGRLNNAWAKAVPLTGGVTITGTLGINGAITAGSDITTATGVVTALEHHVYNTAALGAYIQISNGAQWFWLRVKSGLFEVMDGGNSTSLLSVTNQGAVTINSALSVGVGGWPGIIDSNGAQYGDAFIGVFRTADTYRVGMWKSSANVLQIGRAAADHSGKTSSLSIDVSANSITVPGSLIVPTMAPGNNTTNAATTAFVQAAALRYVNSTNNSGFVVNQRAYVSGTALAASAFGHDRWKAGAGGGTYTFTQSGNPSTIVTITAGTLLQVVEGLSIVGGTYVLSWTGTAQGRIGATAYAASPVTATVTAGTNTTIEFNAGTLGQVKFEVGSSPTTWQPNGHRDELADCQRFFVNIPNVLFSCGSVAGPAYSTSMLWPVTMRATPTVTTTGFSYSGANSGALGAANVAGFYLSAISTGAGGSFASCAINASADL